MKMIKINEKNNLKSLEDEFENIKKIGWFNE